MNEFWLDVSSTAGTSFLENKPNGSYCYKVRTTYTINAETIPGPFSNILNIQVAIQGPSPTPE